jgi:hypothetical protein
LHQHRPTPRGNGCEHGKCHASGMDPPGRPSRSARSGLVSNGRSSHRAQSKPPPLPHCQSIHLVALAYDLHTLQYRWHRHGIADDTSATNSCSNTPDDGLELIVTAVSKDLQLVNIGYCLLMKQFRHAHQPAKPTLTERACPRHAWHVTAGRAARTAEPWPPAVQYMQLTSRRLE